MLVLVLLALCWLSSLAMPLGAQTALGQGGQSGPLQPSLSLAEQVNEACQKYPEVRPLLERILSRLDTALMMLKTPLPELLEKLETSATIIGRQETRLQAQETQQAKLQSELTASKASQEKSEAAWKQERGELIARIEAEKSLREAAERARDISVAVNITQGVANIGQALALIFK